MVNTSTHVYQQLKLMKIFLFRPKMLLLIALGRTYSAIKWVDNFLSSMLSEVSPGMVQYCHQSSRCVSQNFWQAVSEVHLKFLKFTTNLANSLHPCRSNHELRNEVVNFSQILEVVKFVTSKARIIQCSWFGNTTTNESKQSEKNP